MAKMKIQQKNKSTQNITWKTKDFRFKGRTDLDDVIQSTSLELDRKMCLLARLNLSKID